VNTWEETPVIFLVRRNSEEAEEIAKIHLPPDIGSRFLTSIGHNKGVYALDGDLCQWLKDQLQIQ
jgi:hypothetical protein